MKTIGIIGKGFVGGAIYEGMKHAFDIVSWDKAKGWETWDIARNNNPNHNVDLHVCSYLEWVKDDKEKDERGDIFYVAKYSDGPIFVCVPTPMRKDGSCDTSIVESVVMEVDAAVKEMGLLRVVVIKSTVPPGTTERINEMTENVQVCFNPEFLTERNAVEDFKNQDRIIIGGPRPATNVVKQMYETAYPNVPTTKTSSTIAELVKYVTNCFLATKVSFANEIKQVCDKLDVDYDKVIEYARKDTRLGNSHWAVPGPDGSLGFGLTCFPKDLNALIARSKELGVNPTVMEATWEKNLEVRDDRDWERMIGRAISEE
jgi:UDPglucose 6-dehydrogenase